MSAQIDKNHDIKKYRRKIHATYDRLADNIPLQTPWSVMIEPSNKCNFKCVFCPTGDYELLKKVGRPKGNIELDLAKKIILELTDFPEKIRLLNFSKNGEPLLCRDLPEMIRYAKSMGIADKIMTVSNGALMTETMARDLVASGIDHIRISVEHVSSRGYKRVTQNYGNYDTIVENVKNLRSEIERQNASTEVYVKIVDIDLTDPEKEKFLSVFSPISDMINIENLRPWNKSDEKDFALGSNVKLNQKGTQAVREREVCPAPFYSMNVNFNGEVSACAVDWCHGTIIGNAHTHSMLEIWNGELMRNFRLKHLNGQKNQIDACRDCAFIKNFLDASHLDDDAHELVKNFN